MSKLLIIIIALIITIALIAVHIFFRKSEKIIIKISLYLGIFVGVLDILAFFFIPSDYTLTFNNQTTEININEQDNKEITGDTVIYAEDGATINYNTEENTSSTSSSTNAADEKLNEAEQAFIDKDYASAYSIYIDLIEKNTKSPIPYNNLAYFCANGLYVSSDYEQAKTYYKIAYRLGSEVAAGNLLCLFGYADFSEGEYYSLLEVAEENSDPRVEMVLEKMYEALKIDSNTLCYTDDFFSNDISDCKSMLDEVLSLNTISEYPTGSSTSWSGTAFETVTTYGYKLLPAFDMLSGQRFEFVSSSNNTSIASNNESEGTSLIQAQQAILDEEYQNAVMLYYGLIMKGSISPVAYNNLAYLYSNGLGINEDCEKAKQYYEIAFQNGSSVAQGNLLCLISSYDSSQEYNETILSAYQSDNPMVEIILEEIYKILDLQIDTTLYSETFFDVINNAKQIEILDNFFNMSEQTGWGYAQSESHAPVSVPVYGEKHDTLNRIFEYQTIEYLD